MSIDLDVQQVHAQQLEVQQEAFRGEGLALPRGTLSSHIARRMLDMIESGKLPAGARLPSEPKLAHTFQVSRNTIREAIRLLTAQDGLEIRKGIGTFVRATGPSSWPVETGIEELASTTDMIASAGHVPGCRSYRLSVVPATAEVTGALLLDDGAEVYRLSRVRLADEHPVIVLEDYLSVSLVSRDTIEQFDGQGSLFAFLAGLNLIIAVARAVLKPVLPSKEIAEALDVSRREPLLLLRQTHFDNQNKPLIYSDNYINASYIGYHVRRVPRNTLSSHPSSRVGAGVRSPQ